jgi:hypothetical protein
MQLRARLRKGLDVEHHQLQVLGTGTKLHRNHNLLYQIGSRRTHDVGAEDAVRLVSAMSFTMPSVLPDASARPIALKGKVPTL